MIELWVNQALHLSWAQIGVLFLLTWAAISGLVWLWVQGGDDNV